MFKPPFKKFPLIAVLTSVVDSMRRRNEAYKFLPDKIEAVIMDFDGVFTDNRVIVFEDGREAVICNRSDSLVMSKLSPLNIRLVVVSSERNSVVKSRCDKLGIHCISGVEDKLSTVKGWLIDNKINCENVVYIGNDVNDLECIRFVGCGIAVNDAYPEVKRCAKIVLESPGGMGAVRELIDIILLKMERYQKCQYL